MGNDRGQCLSHFRSQAQEVLDETSVRFCRELSSGASADVCGSVVGAILCRISLTSQPEVNRHSVGIAGRCQRIEPPQQLGGRATVWLQCPTDTSSAV